MGWKCIASAYLPHNIGITAALRGPVSLHTTYNTTGKAEDNAPSSSLVRVSPADPADFNSSIRFAEKGRADAGTIHREEKLAFFQDMAAVSRYLSGDEVNKSQERFKSHPKQDETRHYLRARSNTPALHSEASIRRRSRLCTCTRRARQSRTGYWPILARIRTCHWIIPIMAIFPQTGREFVGDVIKGIVQPLRKVYIAPWVAVRPEAHVCCAVFACSSATYRHSLRTMEVMCYFGFGEGNVVCVRLTLLGRYSMAKLY